MIQSTVQSTDSINKQETNKLLNKKQETYKEYFNKWKKIFGALSGASEKSTFKQFQKIKESDFDLLFEKTGNYIRYLEKAKWRKKMNAATFLNPLNDHWKSDWKELTEQENENKSTSTSPKQKVESSEELAARILAERKAKKSAFSVFD